MTIVNRETSFLGFRRENGRVGVRNHVIVLPLDDLSNAAAEAVAHNIKGALAIPHPLWAIAFALCGSAILGVLGLIAGIWADKFDQLAAFQNFIIVPLTFLSGVFYSIQTLPPFWQLVSHFNPFFYMIDGFRYGFFGLSDAPPAQSLAVVGAAVLALSFVALALLSRGWKLRH